jgi:hypothetical protein
MLATDDDGQCFRECRFAAAGAAEDKYALHLVGDVWNDHSVTLLNKSGRE